MDKAKRLGPLNPQESRNLKASIYDLSEQGAKQLLFGLIQILCFKDAIKREKFEEVLDDAMKYNANKKAC